MKIEEIKKSTLMKIADALHYKITEYEMWLRLPRYQIEESDEYYADIMAIIEDLRKILGFVKDNFLEVRIKKIQEQK